MHWDHTTVHQDCSNSYGTRPKARRDFIGGPGCSVWLFHRMEEGDSPQAFLEVFWATAEACRQPEEQWREQLLPLLLGGTPDSSPQSAHGSEGPFWECQPIDYEQPWPCARGLPPKLLGVPNRAGGSANHLHQVAEQNSGQVATARPHKGGGSAAGSDNSRAVCRGTPGRNGGVVLCHGPRTTWQCSQLAFWSSPKEEASPLHRAGMLEVWVDRTPASGLPADRGGAGVPCRRPSDTFPQSVRDA